MTPVEGWIDVGKEACAGAAIAIFDTRRNAFYSSAQHMVAARLGLTRIALGARRLPACLRRKPNNSRHSHV